MRNLESSFLTPLVVAAVALAACGTDDRSAIQDLLSQARATSSREITEEDLAAVPAPVQRYLRKSGVLGVPFLRAVRGRGHAEILFNGSWLALDAENYLTAAPLSRNWISRGKYSGLTMSARDSYCNGEGRMSIRLQDDLRFQEAYGPEMNRGQLVTVLADFALMPTAWLSPAVTWQAVDDRSAQVALSADGITVRGLVKFDEGDELIEFVTDSDRFEDVDGKPVQRRWSAVCQRFEVVQGLRVCTSGTGIWHDENGPREYVRSTLDEVQFDTFELY